MTDFTIADVLAWARTKPASEQYDVYDAEACALGQFGSATGRAYLHDCFNPDEELGTTGLNDALGFDKDAPCTFGALVVRLEALCPETIVPRSDWARLDAYLTDIEQVVA